MGNKTKHNMASDLAWYPTKNSDFSERNVWGIYLTND